MHSIGDVQGLLAKYVKGGGKWANSTQKTCKGPKTERFLVPTAGFLCWSDAPSRAFRGRLWPHWGACGLALLVEFRVTLPYELGTLLGRIGLV